MTRKTHNTHRLILKTLNELHSLHPSYNLGKHISTAMDGHDMWGITDGDFLDALIEYKVKFEMDVEHNDEDISKVIDGGLKLNSLLLTEDDDEFYE